MKPFGATKKGDPRAKNKKIYRQNQSYIPYLI